MKTPLKSVLFIFFLVFTLQSCEDNDDKAAPAELQINDFIWKGLNEVYLWQADVPNLADNRFASQNELNDFLKGYSKPEDLFEDLLYKPESKFPNGDAVDRFSWIVSDYTVLEQELNGVSKNNGVDFRLMRVAAGSNDVVGYVRYIIPNSDASSKAIKRGDLFTKINGTQITVSNYQQLLGQDSYTLNFADYNGSAFVSNGKSVSLTKTVLEENPIFINKVITQGSHKIGYLMYNGFYSDYDEKLNQAFGELKSQGITELVLDLRYNGGGSVRTSTRLATMITGQFGTNVFSKRQYNDKLMQVFSPESLNERFVSDIDGKAVNSLNLSKIYIITTASTASASELIINGLKPYISVVQIGETTTGKNVGSFTVYDSETYVTKEGLNKNHKYAMQPLVFKIANASGFGDYQQGLTADYPQTERITTYGVLGDPAEPLLSKAISVITGTAKRGDNDLEVNPMPYVTDSKIINGLRHGMYLETAPQELLNLIKK